MISVVQQRVHMQSLAIDKVAGKQSTLAQRACFMVEEGVCSI